MRKPNKTPENSQSGGKTRGHGFPLRPRPERAVVLVKRKKKKKKTGHRAFFSRISCKLLAPRNTVLKQQMAGDRRVKRRGWAATPWWLSHTAQSGPKMFASPQTDESGDAGEGVGINYVWEDSAKLVSHGCRPVHRTAARSKRQPVQDRRRQTTPLAMLPVLHNVSTPILQYTTRDRTVRAHIFLSP